MRKTAIILGLIVALALVAGCSSLTTTGQQNPTTTAGTDYRTGSQGLMMRFVQNSPPDKMYDGDNMNLMVELTNEGAYPTTDSFEGKLFISGLDPNAVNGNWEKGNEIPATLQGRSQYLPDGGYDVMTYKDTNGVKVPFGGPEYDASVLVTACYKYETIAEPMVCIDPEPYKAVEEQKVCHYDDAISTGGTQGAPVAVTRVDESVSSENIIFNIYLSNVGGGNVIDWASYNECPFNLGLSDINRIQVKASLPFDQNPECTPVGNGNSPVMLRNGGTGFITCKFKKPSEGTAFKTPLHIELDYVYSSSIQKNLKIVKV